MPTPEQMSCVEQEAINTASPAIGDYLENCGTTDLGQLSPEQWDGFLAHALKSIADEVQRQFEENEVPF